MRGTRLKQRDIFYILLTSIGLISIFPPFPFGFIAPIVLVPFFLFLERKSINESAKGAYIAGMIWSGGTVYWIGWATFPGLIGSILFLPIYFVIFTVIIKFLWSRWGNKSLWTAPLLWTGVELLNSWGPLAFPWNKLAYSQSSYPILIQYADIFGAYGVTFWIVTLNVIFYFLLKNIKRKKEAFRFVAAIILLYTIVMVYGVVSLKRPIAVEERVRLSLVQGNIDPYKKWTSTFIDSNFAIYHRLTDEVASERPDLIIWPETAATCYLRYNYKYLRMVKSQIDSIGISLVTGSPDYIWKRYRGRMTFNSALYFQPNSWEIGRYYKMNLVPFSEKVPFMDKFPFIYDFLRKLNLEVGDFTPGDSTVVFQLKKKDSEKVVPFSVVICYESVFPYLVRKFVNYGAKFLVVITNDGWFGRTSGPYQHAQIAVFRAVENRVWVARCANTGISEFIDPYGRVTSRTPLYEEAVLSGVITTSSRSTFFVHYGMVTVYLIATGNVFVLFIYILRMRKRSQDERKI